MPARERELLRLAVDAGKAHAGKLLAQHGEHSARAAADLEEPRSPRECRPVTDEPLSPVLGLRNEPFLLGRPVAVDVLGHVARVARYARSTTSKLNIIPLSWCSAM